MLRTNPDNSAMALKATHNNIYIVPVYLMSIVPSGLLGQVSARHLRGAANLMPTALEGAREPWASSRPESECQSQRLLLRRGGLWGT